MTAAARRVPIRAVALASVTVWLAACAGGDERPSNDAGVFRLTNVLQGETVTLAPVPREGALPLLRMVVSDDDANTVAHWRLSAFGQGLYRVSSIEAEERLSLAVGYRRAGDGATIGGGAVDAVGLDLTRRSASQLWQVVPLGDGSCRLASALFPDRSLGVAGAESGEPRLAPSEDADAQRWRLSPVGDRAADGLPALCGGQPPAGRLPPPDEVGLGAEPADG